MVDVPTFQNEVQPHLAETPEASHLAMGAAGEGLERAGAEITAPMAEFNARYQDARRQADATNRLAQSAQDLADAQFRWSKTPDRAQALAGFGAESAGLRKKLLDGVSDPLEQQLLGREFDTQAAMRSIDTGHAAFTLESHKRVGDLDTNLTSFAQVLARTQDPALRAHLADQATGSIDSAVRAGWLDPEEGAVKKLGWKSQVDEVAARQMMNGAIESQDPALAQAAARAINDPNQFVNLTAEKRELLTTRIDNMMIRIDQKSIAAQAHRDAMADRVMKDAQRHNAAVILGRVWQGEQIDPVALANLGVSGQLSESGMEAVHTAQIQQARGHDDAMSVANLWTRINSHQATQDDVNLAITSGHLSASTAAGMTRAITSQGPTGNKATQSLFNVLRTQLNGEVLEQGRGGGDSSAALANWTAAQGEWARRVDTNHEDPNAVLTDLMAKYSSGSKPTWLPPLVTGARPMSWAEMVTAAKELKRRNLSPDVFRSQDALLQQYGRFIRRPPPPQPRQGTQQ